jgi:hypothetical protein
LISLPEDFLLELQSKEYVLIIMILQLYAFTLLATVSINLTLSSSVTAANDLNINSDNTAIGLGLVAKKQKQAGNPKLTESQRQKALEMLKIYQEYNEEQEKTIVEMRAIRSNWKTSNASKRPLLAAFRPRLTANIERYMSRMQPHLKTQSAITDFNKLKKLMEEQSYRYLECPDDRGTTMCF